MIKAVALIFGVALCVSCARAGGPGRAALSAGLAGLGGAATASPAPLLDGAPGAYSAAPSLAGTPGASAPVPQAGRTLRVLSFNIREWTRDRDESGEYYWRKRMEAMRRMIEDVDPDVICLQEVLPPAGSYVPDGYHRVGVGVSHPIYVRDGLKASRHSFAIFWEACTVSGIRIVNVHSRWEKEIVERTVRQVNGQLTGRDIACGDWNTGLRSIESAGLRMQSARTLLGAPETDTFANFTKSESHGAIDHFFVNGITPVSYRMLTDGYGVSRISDHWPILLDVELP
jgi:endonuclease/exonuclease/phosphatase family metal-dependent hydrolase